jgi:hypothetical protein
MRPRSTGFPFVDVGVAPMAAACYVHDEETAG